MTIITFGCNQSKTDPANFEPTDKKMVANELKENELDLLNDILPELVGHNRTLDRSRQFEHRSDKSWYDIAIADQKRLDSMSLVFYLHDTLSMSILSEGDKMKIAETAYEGLGAMLKTNHLSTRTIDLGKLKEPNPYKLIKQKPNWSELEFELHRGELRCSPVAFNDDVTKALFFYQFNYGLDKTTRFFVYSEKMNNKWKIRELTDFEDIKITL